MKRMSQPDASAAAEKSPVAWFVMLERARERNDFEGAARASMRLRRLGIDVRYISPVEAQDEQAVTSPR
jgi:hypothetical protein